MLQNILCDAQKIVAPQQKLAYYFDHRLIDSRPIYANYLETIMATAKKAAPTSPAEAASEAVNFWVESSKEFMKPAQELNEIAKRVLEKTSAQNQVVAQRLVDDAKRSSKELANVRDVNTLVEMQMAYLQKATEQFQADAEAYTKVATEAQAEYAAWAEKSLKDATAKFEEAMSKVA